MEMHEDWIREVKLAQLREQLQIAAHQIDRGDSIKINSKADIDRLFADIQQLT
jgi:antitoxin ParD1/3/4